MPFNPVYYFQNNPQWKADILGFGRQGFVQAEFVRNAWQISRHSGVNRVKIGVVRMTDRKKSEAGSFGNLQVRCA